MGSFGMAAVLLTSLGRLLAQEALASSYLRLGNQGQGVQIMTITTSVTIAVIVLVFCSSSPATHFAVLFSARRNTI